MGRDILRREHLQAGDLRAGLAGELLGCTENPEASTAPGGWDGSHRPGKPAGESLNQVDLFSWLWRGK